MNATSTTTNMQPKTEYLTVRETAALLKVGQRTVREILNDIPGVIRLGERTTRIPATGLQAYLRKLEAA